MPSLIAKLTIPDADGPKILDIPVPGKFRLPGSVTALCGPNVSGKTFLLDRTRRALEIAAGYGKPVQGDVVNLEMAVPQEDPRLPNWLYFGRTWREKSSAGHVSLNVSVDKLRLPRDVPDYRRAFLAISYRQLLRHIPSLSDVTLERFCVDIDVRREAIDQIQGETLAYKCASDDAFTNDVEALLEASLYFRRSRDPAKVTQSAKRKGRENQRPPFADHLEFLLLDRNADTSPFDKWSDGQKHVFYIAALLSELKPDVVLIDEPENHLHPTYITRVLDLLKRRVLQTIVATHHPHIIFSNYVDRVFFLDTARPGPQPNPPNTTSHNKLLVGTTPRREVKTLETDFDKISAAYALFANQDNQLLRQAAWVERQSDFLFFTALHHALAERVVGPSCAPIPDAQSLQLVSELKQILRTVSPERAVKILDVGSGIGRTALEISKLPAWRDGKISWTCWEPDEQKRHILSEKLRVAGLPARIPSDLGEVGRETFDICIIANVLHEITPEIAAHLIVQVEALMDKPHAALVILEIFPLLRPEKFAVPYPEDLLRGLFATAGFNARSQRLSVAGGTASAYAVVAKRTREAPALIEAEIRQKFEELWLVLAEMAVASYAATTVVDKVADYSTLMNDLTTLASVAAWRSGRWGMFGHQTTDQ